MTPQARHAAAIDVLDDWLSGKPLEQALLHWSRGARFAGSKDRAAVRDIVFQSVRCRDSYAMIGGVLTGRGMVIGHAACNGSPVPDEDWSKRLSGTFDGLRYGSTALSGEEQQTVADRIGSGVPLPDDIPAWLVDQMQSDLGDAYGEVARTFKTRSPVFLRVNLSKVKRDQAAERLREDDIDTEPVDGIATALRVTRNPRRIAQSKAYAEGLIELQDAAAQKICARIEAEAGDKILDYCAGGGGKALALADQVDARIFAHDISEARMKDIPLRAARAGQKIEILSPGDISAQAPFDVILCDVPCSGTGTWRRTPDAKWSLTKERLDGLRESQAEILRVATGLLTPGGTLHYITCSILKVENDAQIRAFIAQQEAFQHVSSTQSLPGPNGDGFFHAVLAKSV